MSTGNPDNFFETNTKEGVFQFTLVALPKSCPVSQAIDGVQIHGVSKIRPLGNVGSPITARAGHRIVRPRTTPSMDDELLTTGQAAQRLGISTSSFYSWLGCRTPEHSHYRVNQSPSITFKVEPRRREDSH